MSEAQQTYCYSPLNSERKEIRVLIVQPRAQDSGHDPVRCSIRHISLQEVPRPEYETISYTWGDPLRKDFLFLDGLKITVLASAAQALRCVLEHSGGRERVVWIDAICIDQANPSERAQQVAFMGDVYRQSFHNLIYLGDDDGTTNNAFLDFHNLLEEARRETDGFRTFWDVVWDKDHGDWIYDKSPMATKVDYDALVRFYSRPWFRYG
jgi:hypothetical protein